MFKSHNFYSTSGAYDETQCNDDIKTGDTIIIENEGVVGISDTWPIAVTVDHGELHSPKDTISMNGLIDSMNDHPFTPTDFKIAFKEAIEIAESLGYEINPFFKKG